LFLKITISNLNVVFLGGVMNKKIIFLILLTVLTSGCSILDRQLEPTILSRVEGTISAFTEVPTNTPYATLTSYPTNTALPTLTPLPTYTPKIIIVTATATRTPQYTSTITNTPTETSTITPTLDITQTDKGPGFYLVGEEISPGVWRSTGESDSCYWAITSKTGNIINNHFGMAGGTMYIPASGFQVELNQECGTWTYMGN
jgi:hypothetical protein